MTTYFAYGDNMDPGHMATHAPGAERLGIAVLPDHAIGVGAAGFATVHPEAGSAVYGVLWRLTDADEAALDRYEDVAGGFYRKESAVVRAAELGRIPAMIYRAVDDRAGPPDHAYFDRIIGHARAAGLPEGHVRRLVALRAGQPAAGYERDGA